MFLFKPWGILTLIALSWPVFAHDYPTMDRVDHVLTCMRQNGGQNVDNLFRCSCEIDAIAQQLTMEDFNTARTYEIYKDMPGEKGGLFRESADGSTAVEKLAAARKEAQKRCFVGAVRPTGKAQSKAVEKAGAKAAK